MTKETESLSASRKRRRCEPLQPALPKRGYGVRPGTNRPLATAWATPEFAARHADNHWTIFDWSTGETVGVGSDFR